MARPTTPTSERSGVTKRLLVGRAVDSNRLEHTLLPKVLALPVFSSDALSSVAYASEEILRILLLASVASAHLVGPIAAAIAILLAIVVLSYRQTVKAYPNGGGAYIVSKENLGQTPGLVAASALLVDYMMTVVVSTVAGVVAIISAIPSLSPFRVELAVMFVVLVTIANLRGVKEAGTVFAVPTYGFILCVVTVIGFGLFECASRCPVSSLPPGLQPEEGLATGIAAIGLFTILKAFSSGATALTGVEAISNGVPAFRRPQARNASQTLALMGGIAITLFLGISWLTTHIHGLTVSPDRSVMAQIGSAVFGEGSLAFYVVQGFTAAILILAANTAYQDFPRLASILARDRYMPRQFMNRGDRLVFSNGVIGLGLASILVIIAFDANLNKVIQMYVVGVFTSFTLSQTGMVRHWYAERLKGQDASKGWRLSIVINLVGAVTTAVVLVVVTATKFLGGAWLSILVMAAIVPGLLGIHRHYTWVSEQLRRGRVRAGTTGNHHVVVVIREFDAAAAEALGYVRSFRPHDLHIVHPSTSGSVSPEVLESWRAFAGDSSELIPIAGHDLLRSVRGYVRAIRRDTDDVVSVVVPEVVTGRLFAYLLRRRDLIRLKSGMLREPQVVVTDVPARAPKKEHRVGRPLIPQRTVTLVFVSGVNDVTVRAVNYARTLQSAETRAIYFDLDPDTAHKLEERWFGAGLDIPLDIVEAPFRELGAPMLEEVRRFTVRPDTVVNVVIPEFIISSWWQFPLHNQNALFIKRLFLFEDRAVLTSVPFVIEPRQGTPDVAEPAKA
jgi:amino acid transporter